MLNFPENYTARVELILFGDD